MSDLPVCDSCGIGAMVTTHSRKLGRESIDRHRRCNKCGARDRALIRRVETIVKIFPVVCGATQQGGSRRRRRGVEINAQEKPMLNQIDPARLTDADLDALQAVAFNVAEDAKALGVFAVLLLQEEAIRRLTGGASPAAASIPAEWSSRDLAEALMMAPAFALASSTATARAFSKQLSAAISAVAAARLHTLN